jgi:hypothetical protein
MAVTYNVAVKTARMTATRDHFAGGTMELLSAANQVLAVFQLTEDGGAVVGATWSPDFEEWTVNGTSAAGAGTTATAVRFKTGGGSAHLTGIAVGLPDSSAELKLINTSISNGQPVVISSASITHAPDPA